MSIPTIEVAPRLRPTGKPDDRPAGTPRWAVLLAGILVDLAERDLAAGRSNVEGTDAVGANGNGSRKVTR